MTETSSPGPAAAGFAELNGTRVYYEARGRGPAVVLIHAGIAHHGMWDPQVEAFANEFRTIRYDVRGYAETASPPGEYSDHGDLEALLGFLRVERAVFIGASNGGRIAIDFALTHPERVAALVLVGSAIGGAKQTAEVEKLWSTIDGLAERGEVQQAAELTLRMWVDGPHRLPEQVDPAVRMRARQMLDDLYRISLARGPDQGQPQPLEPPAIGRLGEIHAPTLVVIGDQDVHDIVNASERLAREIPGARKVVMPGTAHLPNLEQPDLFNRLVVEFLTTE